MKDWHALLHNEAYCKERNTHIPQAEKLADELHGPKCFSVKEKEREAWSKAWNCTFLETVERHYREGKI